MRRCLITVTSMVSPSIVLQLNWSECVQSIPTTFLDPSAPAAFGATAVNAGCVAILQQFVASPVEVTTFGGPSVAHAP